ncbi:uncharacterized protein LOC116301016 [Actinia tenebrosa]|uniref:Uncharacterized protein LOC116301016 n=1 Tax=Actinia tenebrosa TaxID=6105 RepID=A0A6P8IGL1_ACTTE|nr:uncharacterized protein LOC116301016 [Actinia tenebrosa]
MSVTALQLEDRVPKHQPFSIYLDEALKTLNSEHTPRTIPQRYFKQGYTNRTSELGQKCPNRGRAHKNLGSKLPPDRSMVATKGTQLFPDGGIVGQNAIPDKGMIGTKVIKRRVARVEKEKKIVSERLKTEKEFSFKKSSKMTNVQPLGKLREYRNDYSIDHIPSLKKVDVDDRYEKEKHIQKVLNRLNLNAGPHYKSPTSSSSQKGPVIKNTTGIDFASSLMESHNLTLKQLREFWQDMPSFLNIQAAKLRRKYGIVGSEAADDIDDIAIEIVTKWNTPTTVVLPNIENQISRTLYVVEEEN